MRRHGQPSVHRSARLSFVIIVVMAVVAAVTGCQRGQLAGQSDAPISPFPPCPASVTSPAAAAGPDPASPASRMPDLALACAGGGAAVRLAAIGRPTVVNLWASWCAPCRAELPELQRFAEVAGDRVVVLGVITADSLPRAAAAAHEFRVSFPAVFDPDEQLRRSLGVVGLPITLFVDASGVIRYRYHTGEPLTTARLIALTGPHLGVESIDEPAPGREHDEA